MAIFHRAFALGVISSGAGGSGKGKKVVQEGAIDSTGYENHHVSRHFLYKIRDHFKRDTYSGWPKLSIVCHCQSHLIAGAVVTQGPSPDYKQFSSVLLQANRCLHFDRILADAGYDSEQNHRLAREILHIRETVIPAAKHRPSRRLPHTAYRKQMRQNFDLKSYRHRAQVESVFSQIKRRLESYLRARSFPAQRRECLLKVLTHNLMILAGVGGL